MNTLRYLAAVCVVALLAGIVYRLLPLFGSERMLSSFFLTEDGYLMLTVARNIAIGNGLSVAGGEITTNGVQPLATFIFAVPYIFTGGDKVTSLVGVHLISVVFSLLAAGAIFAFARRALGELTDQGVWPLTVAAVWFTGPLALLHTMNGLETGLYTLMVTVTVLYFGHILRRGGTYTLADQLILGSLCGLVFLSRNDGAFLVIAIFLVRFIQVQVSGQAGFLRAVLEALPAGILTLLWAAPWMIYNYQLFGSIMPISGHSQSNAIAFGANAAVAPIKIFETMFPMLPLPGGADSSLVAAAVAGGITAAVLLAFLWSLIRRKSVFGTVCIAYAIYALMIYGYYSLFFGAPWFLSRYFAPLAPLLITAACYVAIELVSWLFARRREVLLAAGGALSLVLCLALLVRLALPGVREQGHFQVVDWIEQNVEDEVWVGAVQTGTLGYWHDRTINLDGKVNPDALRALQTEGDVLDYVLRTEIQFIADWAGVAGWAAVPGREFGRSFEVVLVDEDRNLSVMRRIAPGG